MKSLEQDVHHLIQLLDELIQTATQLNEVSKQVISEEELAPLQNHQQALLEKIEKTDASLQKNYPNQLDSTTRQILHDRLQMFHTLNQEFIQNLRASHGLIQFELHHLGKESMEDEIQDISSLAKLNKIFSSPDRSQTVDPQKDK